MNRIFFIKQNEGTRWFLQIEKLLLIIFSLKYWPGKHSSTCIQRHIKILCEKCSEYASSDKLSSV